MQLPKGLAAEGVTTYRGVPYATAQRFQPPQQLPLAGGDATQHGPIAPQGPSRLAVVMGDFTRPQSEDCLTLTIATPGGEGRAVMVFLHGGAWMSGAGSLDWYDGSTLAREQGIVVVGVNYRLGALGYIHLPGVTPGNLGTMDQITALRWVRDNIAAFGGDPARVTVAGQSAGAASIGRMIVDPEARPLFRRVILQSGSFGRPPPSRAQAAEIGATFARLLDDDPLTAPPAKLVATTGALARQMAKFAETNPPFMPLIEHPATQEDLRAEMAAASPGLDVLIGTTREEVHAFFAANPAMENPPADAVAARFALAGGIEPFRARRPGGSAMDLLSDLGTQDTFAHPSMRLAAAMTGAAVHAYQFDWAPPGNRFKAAHCIELPFVFGTLPAWPGAGMLAGGDPVVTEALSAVLRAHWGAFVRDGNAGLPWAPYEPTFRMTMVYGDLCGPVGNSMGLTA